VKAIQDWLTPTLLDETLEIYDKLRRTRLPDTCKWVFTIDSVRDWLDPDGLVRTHRPVLFYGKAGSGKSVLSAFLYDRVKSVVKRRLSPSLEDNPCAGTSESANCEIQDKSKRSAALYFPLRANQRITAVIATFIDNILRSRPFDIELQGIVTVFMNENARLTFTTSVELFAKLLCHFDRT
jgi:Cdc6-like AAA superfamily ATPase